MATHKIFIAGEITPFSYEDYDSNLYCIKDLNNSLNELKVQEGDELIVDIHTFGGDTDTGFAMYNMLKRFKNENNISLTTRVTGYCASIGTVILLAGDKRIGNEFNTPFVHNAWTFERGDANQMKKIALELEVTNNKIAKLYSKETTIDVDTALQLMQNSEFLPIEKTLEYGFYTEIENKVTTLNKIFNSLNNYKSKNMSLNEKVNQIWNKLFQTKNVLVYTADNTEVDFFELQEGDPVLVGAKATINGEKATGEHVMPSGETYVFVDGVLEEIKEAQSDETMAELQNKITELNAQIESLTQSQNALKRENEKYKEFKNQVLNIKIETPEIEKKDKKEPKKERVLNLYPEKK